MADPKEKAISLLKNRDKTEYEIKEALKKNGFSEIEIEDTIEYLLRMKYINDEEYAARFIEISMGKKRGPLRITRELEAKGVHFSIIENALYDNMDSDWEWETAETIVASIKSKNSGLNDDKVLAKIVNKLNYEGFSEEIINDIVEDLYSDI